MFGIISKSVLDLLVYGSIIIGRGAASRLFNEKVIILLFPYI